MTAAGILRHGRKHREHDRAAAKERERRHRKAADWLALVEVLGLEEAVKILKAEVWLDIRTGLRPIVPEDCRFIDHLQPAELRPDLRRWQKGSK